MTNELMVQVSEQKFSMALLEDGRLVEYQTLGRGEGLVLGDVYWGTVKRNNTGLNAAFVDIGYIDVNGKKKEGFLSYKDLGISFLRQQKLIEYVLKGRDIADKEVLEALSQVGDLPKDGRIEHYLKPGQNVLVMVSREAISTKGPTLTCELSFSGRNLVLKPLEKRVSVSSQLRTNNKAKGRELQKHFSDLIPPHMGLIVRTAAASEDNYEVLDRELDKLLNRFWQLIAKISAKPQAPLQLYKEDDRLTVFLRDRFNNDFKYIWVDDQECHEYLKNYIAEIAPGREHIVRLYTGNKTLFDVKEITRQKKKMFSQKIYLDKGAWLEIEQTEAMHVIDVNSGNRSKRSSEQEETAIDVNRLAAVEIARQIRLRDLGGIIAIDFIDMKRDKHLTDLYEYMAKLMREDRATHKVYPISSEVGVMHITRQRIRESVQMRIEEQCPSCGGTGKTRASFLLDDRIELHLKQLISRHSYIRVEVHPYVAAYLNKGLISKALKWRFRIGNVRVVANAELDFLDYRFLNRKGERIAYEAEKREFERMNFATEDSVSNDDDD